MDAITLDDAMYLFILPRTLGETAEGEKIVSNVGQFGPYVKYGSKYVSLKEDDPYTVTLERALEVIRLKKEADANRLILDFPDDGIQVLNGRYGPYITDKKKNAKIPKDRDPKSLTLGECKTLLEAAPERGTGRFGRFRRGKKAAATTAAPAAGDGVAAEAKGKGAGKKKKAAANGEAVGDGAAGAPKAAGARSAAGKGAAGKATAGAVGRGASGKPGSKATATGSATGPGAKPTHVTPASHAASPARGAAHAAAKKAMAGTAQSAKGTAKAKVGAHDGHKASATASKAKASAKTGKAAKAPASGKPSSTRPRGVK
jgi:DNA topoisomerase I